MIRAAHIAAFLLNGSDPVEGSQRGAARLIGRHVAGQIFLNLSFEVIA